MGCFRIKNEDILNPKRVITFMCHKSCPRGRHIEYLQMNTKD